MLPHIYFAPGVEMVLLMISFAVVVSAVGVLTLLGKSIRFPPMVSLVHSFSFFCAVWIPGEALTGFFVYDNSCAWWCQGCFVKVKGAFQHGVCQYLRVAA